MKVYGWVPKSYGPWAYVMAESPEAAVEALKKKRDFLDKTLWSYEYSLKDLNEWISRPPDEVHEEGDVFEGEYS